MEFLKGILVFIAKILPYAIYIIIFLAALKFGIPALMKLLRGSPTQKTAGTPPVQTPSLSAQELYHQKCVLEQKMAHVAGGQNGLFVLLEQIKSSGNTELYRKSYRNGQSRLREYMEEYQTVIGQTRALPEEEQKRFLPPEEIAAYRQLLEENV